MIQLNYRDARPIYLQVKDGLRHLVVTGAIREGEQFPSVRALAASLAINPNTSQGASAAVELAGTLGGGGGRGVLATCGAGGADGRREALLKQLDEAVTELLFLGMTPKELAQRVSEAGTKGESAI